MSTHAIQATGMAWYLAEDFGQVKALMTDSHKLHRTHTEWQRAAEQGEQSFRAKGGRVYRAILRPAAFQAWCSTRRLDIDAKARNQFASEFAAQELSAGR
jgi:hypothetical protein